MKKKTSTASSSYSSKRNKTRTSAKGSRTSTINRKTKETNVSVVLKIDGKANVSVNTGIKFIDHLISSLGKHSAMDLKLVSKSMDGIDHHLIEDTAIALGNCMSNALGDRSGVSRFGYAVVPMDEAAAEAIVDLVKRQYYRIDLEIRRNQVEGVSKEDMLHFLESLLANLNSCCHLNLKYGKNDHHKIEAAIKALAVAWRMASSKDTERIGIIPSTKGAM